MGIEGPKVLGSAEGQLSGWAAPKDVILQLAGKLTVRGGTGFIIEYLGPGVDSLSCTGMATICNMGAEMGATTSIFPFTKYMYAYLNKTHRRQLRKSRQHTGAERDFRPMLCSDQGAEYDEVIEIDLSTLEPHINGPFTPDLSRPLAVQGGRQDQHMARVIRRRPDWQLHNSSFQDMTRAEDLVRQAQRRSET